MPIVGVSRNRLFTALGKTFSDSEFEDVCFEYGIELDDVTTEKKMKLKELNRTDVETAEPDDEIIYRIDIPANRYDMLCLEGIARALNIFSGKLPSLTYTVADMTGRPVQQMIVKPETAAIRPFIVCGILRGINFDKHRYNSFIDLQDKLHQNLCRQRSLVSIGTHDLAKIQAPFTYEALPPEDIRFVPLKQTQEVNAKQLIQYYLANDSKLKRFVPIIQDSVVYPVVMDAKRQVLSLPPIINSSLSQISLDTKDVFVEVTATDLAKAEIVLNTVCAMFSEYCSVPFEVEPVEVVDPFGLHHRWPKLQAQERQVKPAYINAYLGLDLPAARIATLLNRMGLHASVSGSGEEVLVSIPPTRSDILHDADVMEDVAIAYGYNQMDREVPVVATFGKELPLMQLTELLRQEMKDYTEALTWALCSRSENFGCLRQVDNNNAAVSIGNPATAEFEVCRTTLLPALLKMVSANKDAALPLKLFEISDVILLDPRSEAGCRNERHLAAVHCSRETEFELMHGVLNRVMDLMGIPLAGQEGHEDSTAQKPSGILGLFSIPSHRLSHAGSLAKLDGDSMESHTEGYEWRQAENSTYFPGRHADILLHGVRIGSFGVLHPDVLDSFDIANPVTALELSIEPFCFDQMHKPLQTHAWQ